MLPSSKYFDIIGMCFWGDEGDTICIVPSICALSTSKPSKSTVFLHLRCPTWLSAVRRKLSCCWDRIVLMLVGEAYSVLSLDWLVFDTPCARSLSCATLCTETGKMLELSLAYSAKSHFSGFSPLSNVFYCDNASAAWCLMQTRSTTSN